MPLIESLVMVSQGKKGADMWIVRLVYVMHSNAKTLYDCPDCNNEMVFMEFRTVCLKEKLFTDDLLYLTEDTH